MKVAIYMRVSDPHKGQTTDNQVPDIERFVKTRELEVYKTYIDGISAVKKRPQWETMMQDAFQGKFKAIVVWKLDRFARSLKDLVVSLDQLSKWKVSFISVTQGVDTSDDNPMSRLMIQVLGIMAEFERSLMSERIRAGMARRKAEGGSLGRKKLVFDIEKAKELHESGMGWRKVAEVMQVPKSTLLERLNQK